MKKNSLSIVIPAKNESETIEKVLIELRKTFKKLSRQYKSEVIVVCDSADDPTLNLLKKYDVKIIINNNGNGKGNALISGFKKTTGNIIITMDGDYSHQAGDIPHLINELDRGNSLVIGSRIIGGTDENEFIRMLGNVFLTLLFGILFGKFFSDTLNGFKAFKKELINKQPFQSKGFEIEIEIIARALMKGINVSEVASHERARSGGKPKSKVFIHGPILLWSVIYWGLKYRFSKEHAIKQKN